MNIVAAHNICKNILSVFVARTKGMGATTIKNSVKTTLIILSSKDFGLTSFVVSSIVILIQCALFLLPIQPYKTNVKHDEQNSNKRYRCP